MQKVLLFGALPFKCLAVPFFPWDYKFDQDLLCRFRPIELHLVSRLSERPGEIAAFLPGLPSCPMIGPFIAGDFVVAVVDSFSATLRTWLILTFSHVVGECHEHLAMAPSIG